MASCTVPSHDNATSGDNLYGPRACWQDLVDWAWAAFGFKNEYWDDGFGYEDPCNRDLPVNRTMAAIWLLCYSAVASASGSNVNLYLGYWYNQDVSVRASTLLHEARHLGGKSHNANFPAGSIFGAGSGADSSWGYEGAWMYETLYLWWFYADGRRSTTALKSRARQEANLYIDNAFATHPGFSIA